MTRVVNKKKISAIGAGLVLVALLIGSGWIAWTKVVVDPDKVLSGAIENSLRTNSVTRTVDQQQPSNGVEQVSYISFYQPDPYTNTRTVLTQDVVGGDDATVVTETYGLNDVDYVRYVSANGIGGEDGTGGLGDLIGTWAKRNANIDAAEITTFFNEGLFGIFPFGNLSSEARSQLLDQINEKNLYSYTTAEKMFDNKRLVYVYRLNINTADLVEVIRNYMVLSGNGDASQLNLAEYQNAPPIQVQVTVDIMSRQIVEIVYPQNRVETFSGYGLYRPLDLPTETVPIDDLQERVRQTQV